MEPALQRGDILFLNNNAPQVNVGVYIISSYPAPLLFVRAEHSLPCRPGDIVVFKIAGRDIPIVHRVLWLHQHADTGEVDYLTKGDNNNVHDRNLYAPGQMWLRRTDILGAGVAFVPYLGMVTILLNDYPALKYVLVGLMGLFVLTGRES
jgi:signal peptidase